eukprot:6205220-Pleurochrysis_carterae.AAC.2
MSQKERRSTVCNALQFESVVTNLHESTEQKAPVRFIVGPSAGNQRAVCDLFCKHQMSVPDATVHPIMMFTHNWTTYFDTDICDSIANLNTARELIIRKQEKDGGVRKYPAML